MATIPVFLLRVLLDNPAADEIQRFTQDGSVARDVWLAFASNTDRPLRLIVTPASGTPGVKVAAALHQALQKRIRQIETPEVRRRPAVAPLDSYVLATLTLDELLAVVLPMTSWWSDMDLRGVYQRPESLAPVLQRAMRMRLFERRRQTTKDAALNSERRVEARLLDAAPVIALIGVLAAGHRAQLPMPASESGLASWLERNLPAIARGAAEVLSEQFKLQLLVEREAAGGPLKFRQFLEAGKSPPLIHRVFVDRPAHMAEAEALSTIKADAAGRVFDVKCNDITWAVIDSGIDATHPSFIDHSAPAKAPRTRIRAAYDFSRIDAVRNFNLTLSPAGSSGREQDIDAVLAELLKIPGQKATPSYRATAKNNLDKIAQQLDAELSPDWSLIEPLIKIPTTDGSELVSDHGTLVAGVLGGDWRNDNSIVMRGVCPDINIIDLRVLNAQSLSSTESAVIAAVEFVRFLNQRELSQEIVVAGVNISMSIPYDPKRYGCGVTPVCTACDRLSDAGVVVVVAAGNKGWSGSHSEDTAQGSGTAANNVFQFCSITDPGNAHDVITVGSTHRLKPHLHGISYFSSRGPTGDGRIKPDLVAPGEKISGPLRGGVSGERDGTSFAAPFVSGAAAMVLARHKELLGDPARVKEILCSTATDLGRERYFQGHGLVDVLRALQSV